MIDLIDFVGQTPIVALMTLAGGLGTWLGVVVGRSCW